MLAKKALAGTAGAPKLYVENVFSCFLYTGNGSTQTITNNIDLSTEGGLVWTKNRDTAGTNHILCDTGRGITNYINSNNTNGQNANGSLTDVLTATTSTGYSLGADATLSAVNVNAKTYASWTFRKAKKFFDVVTYTGNGSNRTISHNLGSTPGCIIVKRTDATAGWPVYHRSIGASQALELQITNAAFSSSSYWNNTEPTSTVFTVGTDSYVNANGGTYVAYLFAHDAGGFGDAGSDSIIKCGSFTTDGSGNATVDLGWEPQWILAKGTSTARNWWIFDTMRSMSNTGLIGLKANASDADYDFGGGYCIPTATGFKPTSFDSSGVTWAYIAIRRGPMKTPTSGTSVFAVTSFTGVDAAQTSNFPVDFVMNSENLTGATEWYWVDRLRGANKRSESSAANAEGSVSSGVWDSNTTVRISGSGNSYKRSYPMFRRAPGFFDVVCYTGTDTGSQAISHNLGVAPELMIVKRRNGAQDWYVYSATTGNTRTLFLNLTDAQASASTGYWNNTSPTSTQFTVGSQINVSNTYVAYLFASVSGVSKVGSYTGNGSSVTVTTGFQPRFVMVKRYDSTGNWITGNSALGLVSADEPALFINTRDTETTGQDWVDISSTGFTVNSTALNANVNTGTYIYLAIA